MPRATLCCLALGLALATACDSKPAETQPAKAGEARPTDAEPTDAEPTDVKPPETKAADAKTPDAADPGAGAAAVAPSADEASRFGSCKVSITGAVTKSFEAPGGMSALGSDHFMNDDELRKALAVLSGPDGVEDAMKKDPRIYTLIVNCVTKGLNLSFLPGKGTTYADVPFGPKRYAIKSGREDGKGKMSVMLLVDQDMYSPLPGGFLDVTKLDGTGLAGTFQLEATGARGKIQVSGTIDYACAHDTAMCRAGRGE